MPRPRAAEAAFIVRNGASPLQRKALRHGAPPSCSARRQQDPPAGARDMLAGTRSSGRTCAGDGASGRTLGAARPRLRGIALSHLRRARARPPCCPHRPRPRAVARGRTRRGPDAAPSRWQLRARLRSRHCRWFRLRQAPARWRLLATPGPETAGNPERRPTNGRRARNGTERLPARPAGPRPRSERAWRRPSPGPTRSP